MVIRLKLQKENYFLFFLIVGDELTSTLPHSSLEYVSGFPLVLGGKPGHYSKQEDVALFIKEVKVIVSKNSVG